MLFTTCHCTRLRRAAHTVTRLYDEALADAGLTVTQFSLLRTISRLDEPYISTLAEATGLERSTLGRNLRPLEKAGLVAFGRAEDARMRVVRLTPGGEHTLQQALPRWRTAQRRLADTLGAERLAALEALLDDVVDR